MNDNDILSYDELDDACRMFAADAARWHDACTALVLALGVVAGAVAWLAVAR